MNDALRSSFPVITDDLLTCIGKLFPVPRPFPGDALDKLMFLSGQASVVDQLRDIQKWQKANKQIGV